MSLFPGNREQLRKNGAGVGLGIFALLVAGFGLLGVGGLLYSTSHLISESKVVKGLIARGILPADTPPDALLDLSEAHDASVGCALAGGELIAWQAKGRVVRATLEGATLTREGHDLVVYRSGEALRCRLGESGEDDAFFEMVRARTVARKPNDPTIWTP